MTPSLHQPSPSRQPALSRGPPLPAGGSAYPHEGGKAVGGNGNGKGDMDFGLTPDMVDRKIQEAMEKMKKEMVATA